jgi:hypothetical protein
MNGPDEIKAILLDILRIGLLRIRTFGGQGLADACSIEADHLHNIPTLLKTDKWDLLLYYYNVERPAYIKRAPLSADDFRPFWDRLYSFIQTQSSLNHIKQGYS